MDPTGKTGRFRFLSWRTVLSFFFWSLMPSIYVVYQFWPLITMLVTHGINKRPILILGFAALNITALLTLPFLRVNLIVKGKISLDATWRSVDLMTAPAMLIYFSAMIWNSVNMYHYNQSLFDLVVSAATYLIIITQIGTGLLIFNMAVNWLDEENNAIDKASCSGDLLSAFTRLINKYRNIKDSTGGLLFFMCFSFGLSLFGSAWLVADFPFANAMPFVLTTLANFLLLTVLTTLADNAYERLFIHQDKLR